MNEHFNLIRTYCEVLAEATTPYSGIYYKEDGMGYAEFDTPSGLAQYSCDSLEDFYALCEDITEDDGESIDDMDEPDDYGLEMGFDP